MRAKMLVPIAGLLLSACTGTAVVPPVTVDTSGMKPAPGHYAATVQSGGWNLTLTKSQGYGCGAWSFTADIDPSYAGAMKDVLTRSLEKVDFTADILSADQMKANGYDAQVIVQQGNADSTFSIRPNFFNASISGNVSLSAIVAIRDQTGLVYQNTVNANGYGSRDVFGCPSIGEAVGAAAQDAVQTTVKDIILNIRDGLNKAQAAKKPTS